MSKKQFFYKRAINQIEMIYSHIKTNGYYIVFELYLFFFLFYEIIQKQEQSKYTDNFLELSVIVTRNMMIRNDNFVKIKY